MKKIFYIIALLYSTINSYFIGKYASPYNVLNTLYSKTISISSEELNKLVTANILKDLELNPDNKPNISLTYSIFGSPIFEPVPEKIFNISYHNEVRDWLIGQECFNPLEFNLPIKMGIFKANGVINSPKNSASIDKLNPESVHIHDAGEAYSPNNVKFKILDDREIASFWSVAISPDKQNIALNFNLIILNPVVEDLFSELFLNNSLSEATRMLHDLVIDNADLLEADKDSLVDSLNIFIDI